MNQPTEPTLSKSRMAICDAFNRLILQRPFSEFHVADIIAEADVSRSTFYQHFRSKEALLKQCLVPVLELLAQAGFDDCEMPGLNLVMQHFIDHKPLVQTYLNSPISGIAVEVLSEMIQRQAGNLARGTSQRLPIGLLSVQIAESQIGLIRAWLQSADPIETRLVTQRIHDSARALLNC